MSADFSARSELSPTAAGLIENTLQIQAVVLDWCYEFYNQDRRHSSTSMTSPINYENTRYPKPASIALRGCLPIGARERALPEKVSVFTPTACRC